MIAITFESIDLTKIITAVCVAAPACLAAYASIRANRAIRAHDEWERNKVIPLIEKVTTQNGTDAAPRP